MANYQNLLDAISAVIKTNNRREITGQILQNVLNEMVGSLGENMQLTGFANPLTNPGTPDQNVFYFAEQAGVYRYFDNIELDDGFSVLMWKNGQWTANTLEIAITRQWVESNFVSIDFFRKMFRAYDSGGTEVLPNDMESIIQNIKATCGFWTEQYLSALGIGQGGGGGGVTQLSQLTDVALSNPQNGQALIYNSTLGKWVNGAAGVDMTTVWSNLADNGAQQINYSHLTSAFGTALSDMATRTWVNQQIADMATRTWVSQNYISISFFNRLFKAYNGSTQVNPNDTTSTIDRIKAMFGFYTDLWVSALGTGGVSGTGISLGQLNDVSVSGVTNGQVLSYDSTTNKWVPVTVSGGGGGTVAWADITGKPSTFPPSAHNHDERYYLNNGTIHLASNSITPITSHQDLSAYATQSWVQSNFLGSGALSGYATTSWVEGGFVSNMGGTIHGNIHLKWNNSNYGTYVVFGDRPSSGQDYAYIGENTDDHMTLYGYKGVLVQAGGSGGVSGRLILESLVTAEDSGIDIVCNGDSFLRLVSHGTDYGTVEITASHNIPLYTINETAVVQLQDWSWNGSWTHNAGAVTILTKNGNITLNPSGGNTEVYNFVNRSDIRDKDIVRYMEYDMDIFTRAPLFSFTWKQGSDRRVRIGTSAQYWMDYIPEVVSEITKYDKHGRLLDEHLSLDYITLCYAGIVTVARKVSDHEARIKKIEKELSIEV